MTHPGRKLPSDAVEPLSGSVVYGASNAIRGQVTALRKLITAEWQRRHPGTTCPDLPPRVQGYQRYRTNKTVAAELAIVRVKRGLPPIAFAWRRNAVTASGRQLSN